MHNVRRHAVARADMGYFSSNAVLAVISAPGAVPRSHTVKIKESGAQGQLILRNGTAGPPMLKEGVAFSVEIESGVLTVDGSKLEYAGISEYEYW